MSRVLDMMLRRGRSNTEGSMPPEITPSSPSSSPGTATTPKSRGKQPPPAITLQDFYDLQNALLVAKNESYNASVAAKRTDKILTTVRRSFPWMLSSANNALATEAGRGDRGIPAETGESDIDCSVDDLVVSNTPASLSLSQLRERICVAQADVALLEGVEQECWAMAAGEFAQYASHLVTASSVDVKGGGEGGDDVEKLTVVLKTTRQANDDLRLENAALTEQLTYLRSALDKSSSAIHDDLLARNERHMAALKAELDACRAELVKSKDPSAPAMEGVLKGSPSLAAVPPPTDDVVALTLELQSVRDDRQRMADTMAELRVFVDSLESRVKTVQDENRELTEKLTRALRSADASQQALDEAERHAAAQGDVTAEMRLRLREAESKAAYCAKLSAEAAKEVEEAQIKVQDRTLRVKELEAICDDLRNSREIAVDRVSGLERELIDAQAAVRMAEKKHSQLLKELRTQVMKEKNLREGLENAVQRQVSTGADVAMTASVVIGSNSDPTGKKTVRNFQDEAVDLLRSQDRERIELLLEEHFYLGRSNAKLRSDAITTAEKMTFLQENCALLAVDREHREQLQIEKTELEQRCRALEQQLKASSSSSIGEGLGDDAS